MRDLTAVDSSALSCCEATTQSDIREVVREKYSRIARGEHGCGCSMIGDAYDEVAGYEPDADLGLGCGLPVDHAGLRPGQTVLDLGSGAGLDVFVARRIVGDGGQVIGVDFSKAMVAKAQVNAEKLRYRNVRFVHGDIEALPLAPGSVDVVISNCVLNLVPDKRAAFREIYRVLRTGGHMAISDIVLEGPLPSALRESVEAYVGCIAGAMERAAYLQVIREAGFVKVRVAEERTIAQALGACSVTIVGKKQ